ncbi:MBL fold metallo-hydrolase [Neotabrizicola shimadae]|uniref:MBL fold metallo-hydrolase n=1 Tax=Neotabrizicola shimadae TaxID=2807096 RepID=A0A8G0ZZC7_9RHOB|nr:MBL fold metallo-hydrolase [Neotabrizicola shimadae]QYZ71783.1 MBL fold metallo-hydrolase [Neotabrizicola shimadae]
MGWFQTHEVEPGLFLTVEPHVDPMFRANLYTLLGRDADLQLDFGVGVTPLRPALPPTGKPVIAVASHGHVDHVGGFHEFASRWGPEPEAHVFADMAEPGTLQGVFRGWPDALTAQPEPGFRLDQWRLAPAPLTHSLREGDRIELGDRQFTVLILPGHSPGCLALLDERDGLFLTGDAIYDDELVDDIPGASVAEYRQTMARLMEIDFRIGHGGHGPAFTPARLRQIALAYLAETDGASSVR